MWPPGRLTPHARTSLPGNRITRPAFLIDDRDPLRVGTEAFDALCENRHPVTGERITARTKTARRCGRNLNFHVPKSVSVADGLTGDPAVLVAFMAAAQETLAEVETGRYSFLTFGKKYRCGHRDGGVAFDLNAYRLFADVST